jgi:hypothetical protein
VGQRLLQGHLHLLLVLLSLPLVQLRPLQLQPLLR